MRIHEILHEAPIGDIGFFGSHEPASLRSDDIGIVTSPKGLAKIRRVLEKAPVLIHLAFINHGMEYDSPEGIGDPLRTVKKPEGSIRASGVMTPEQFHAVYGHALRADPQALTVAFGFNEGQERWPLTPWLIAHRIGHALHEARMETRSGGPFLPLLMDLQRISGDLPPDTVSLKSTDGRWVMFDTDSLLYAIGSFKSAREGHMFSIPEFVMESFAQFLVQGRVVFKPVGRHIPARITPDAVRKYKFDQPDYTYVVNQPEILNARVEAWRKKAERVFTEVLNSHIGDIVVL